MLKHEGLHTRRTTPEADNPLEAIYASKWAALNDPIISRGTLDWILGDGSQAASEIGSNEYDLSERDAVVAATVIQWLGSPVGQNFVEECLAAHGKRIISAPKGKR